jgi:cytochrome b
MTAPTDAKLKVWDLPTRVFHWLIVALFIVSYVSAEEAMKIHMWSGTLIFTLVATRILWGFFGSTTSRFGSFVKGPKTVLGYAQQLRPGYAPAVFGHTPTGGWMIVALLALLLLMPMVGAFGNDDTTFRGPLSYLVDKQTSDALTELHEALFSILISLVILHVLAVVVYRFVFKEDLVRPMITGERPWRGPLPAARFASARLALLLWLAMLALVYVYVLR